MVGTRTALPRSSPWRYRRRSPADRLRTALDHGRGVQRRGPCLSSPQSPTSSAAPATLAAPKPERPRKPVSIVGPAGNGARRRGYQRTLQSLRLPRAGRKWRFAVPPGSRPRCRYRRLSGPLGHSAGQRSDRDRAARWRISASCDGYPIAWLRRRCDQFLRPHQPQPAAHPPASPGRAHRLDRAVHAADSPAPLLRHRGSQRAHRRKRPGARERY